MSLLGIDIGTAGCKVMIFDEEGQVLAREVRDYPVLTPRLHWAEQDAEQVWLSVKQCMATAIAMVMPYDPPRAMAIAAQGEAIIPVDGVGHALRPVILGMDARSARETKWLDEHFGAFEFFQRTGMPLSIVNTLSKLLWLEKNEPAVFHSADQFLFYEDFILRRLTGRAVISRSLASRTQMYDIAGDTWANDILNECDIDASCLAELAPEKITPVGHLGKELLQEFGLKEDVQVMAGGYDQACAALGCAAIQPGLAMVSTEATEALVVVLDKPILHKSLFKDNISIYRHAVPGQYLAMTLNQNIGSALHWFHDTFFHRAHAQDEHPCQNVFDLILKGLSPAPTSLLVLPHFSGSGTPSLDPLSKGVIAGLTFASDSHTIAKAILEGLSYELRMNLEILRHSGIELGQVFAVGEGAKSQPWLQLKADVCNMELYVPRVLDAACLGTALLAGIGIGVYADVAQAVQAAVKTPRRIPPQEQNVQAYDRLFHLYEKLYPAVKEIQHQL